MNKQELIEEIEDLKDLNQLFGNNPGYIKIDTVMGLVSKLDEPQKVTVPQYVADWIEVCKEHLTSSLYLAMAPSFLKTNNQGIELTIWIKKNEETFARAWLDGFEIEKEKRYIVKVKGVEKGYDYLNYRISLDNWFFSGESEPEDFRTKHTRKQLEIGGFGDVFNNPMFEVVEVEE